MNARTQITLDPEQERRAQSKAAELGISFAEYVRRLIAMDLGEPQQRADVSIIFNPIDEGVATDIARDKDEMIGEAVWSEYLRKTGRIFQDTKSEQKTALSTSSIHRSGLHPWSHGIAVTLARVLPYWRLGNLAAPK